MNAIIGDSDLTRNDCLIQNVVKSLNADVIILQNKVIWFCDLYDTIKMRFKHNIVYI